MRSNDGRLAEPKAAQHRLYSLVVAFLKFNQKSKFIKKERKENLFSKKKLNRKDDKILYGGCERKNNKIRWLRKGRERFYAFPRLFADFMEGLRFLCLPKQIIKAFWFLWGDQLSAACACRGPAFGLDSCEAVKPAQRVGRTRIKAKCRAEASTTCRKLIPEQKPALIICWGKHNNLKPSIKSAKSLGNA